jgi:small subunit ribosomal protein S20
MRRVVSQGRIVTLANTKSAEKRIRSNERKRVRNLSYRSRVKTMIRKAEQLIFGGQPSEDAVREAISTLDKAAVKGIIHKNNAARRKSRLMKKLNTQAAVAAAAAAKPARKSTRKATTKRATA